MDQYGTNREYGSIKTVNISKSSLQSIEDALQVLKDQNIAETEVIFVGGTVMEVLGLRKAADIDLIVTPDKREQLELAYRGQRRGSFEAIDLDSDIQILKNPYRFISFSDNDCFEEDLFFIAQASEDQRVNIILPELEFGKKLFRDRDKDRDDIILLQRYATQAEAWRWDLIPVAPVSLIERSFLNKYGLTRGEVLTTMAVQGLQNPRGAAHKVFQRLKRIFSRIHNLERAISPKSMCTHILDVGTLVQLQFDRGRFSRYDTLVRLDALEKYLVSSEVADLGDEQLAVSFSDNAFIYYDQMQSLRIKKDTKLRFQELITEDFY